MEVTTLLSKLFSDQKKVISIKKLSEIQVPQEEPQDDHETENEIMLQMKIDSLKQQIDRLEAQKNKVLADLKVAIEEEKKQWEEEKERTKKAAEELGYKIGYDAGYEEVFQQYRNLLSEANSIVDAAKKEFEKTLEKHEGTILHLAILVARRIMEQTISEEPERFLPIVRQALDELKDSSYVSIVVHPNKYDLVVKQKEELEHTLREENVLSIYVDEDLKEHDCIIKHPYGQIDVSIDAQLQQIKKALAEKIAEK